MNKQTARFLTSFLALGAALCTFPKPMFSDVFDQINLVSDVHGLALNTDSNLKNPWGVSFATGSPFWISDQGTSVTTLYTGTGTQVPLVVGIGGGPTGQAFTGAGGFTETGGASALFSFATLSGTIAAWNPSNGSASPIQATAAGAVFTGLALANNGTANYLYAADVKGGRIDVFNEHFAATALSGNFTDPHLPAGYKPYNIQAINNQLYVEYENPSKGQGAVSVFDANGHFVKELIAPGGSHLDDPWGITIAPAGFGRFGNALLVGNFGNGWINAFNPTTGAFLGTVDGANGQPEVISGLWSLSTRTEAGFDPNAVYFTAGINGEQDGLFGKLDPAPEPLSLGLAGLGFAAAAMFSYRRRTQAK